MKHLLLTLEYPPQKGGVSAYLENLVKQFDKKDVVVLANRSKNTFLFDQKQNYTIHRYKLLGKLWPRWWNSYNLAKQIINKEKIDHLIISHVLPMGYVALMLKIPFTVIMHGMDLMLAKSKPHKAYFLKKILSKAKHIVVNSNYTKAEVLVEGVAENKIYVCYPCPNVLNTKIDQGRKKIFIDAYKLKNKKVLLSVNRLVQRKGNDKVIESLSIIRDELPFDIKYLIVGNGPYQMKLEKLIQKLNMQDVVQIVNNVNNEDLLYFYEICDLFIMPARIESLYDVEGFGIVYLEAALHKKPSIAGNVGGAPEAVIDGKTGLLTNPDDPLDIGFKIIQILGDKSLAQKLGESGCERATKYFQWKKQFSSYIRKLVP